MRAGRFAAATAGAMAFALARVVTAAPPPAQPSATNPESIADRAAALKPGEFVWAPEIAPAGPVVIIVSLTNQRAVVYRNGVPIAISTVSTGRRGHATPTGLFTILQKDIDHRSSLYDDAPMPYMQRLTWGGVALHGGRLPGYPASHGCIRLPQAFARLLYGVTRLGLTVVITEDAAVPRVAPAPDPLEPTASDLDESTPPGRIVWRPERAPEGPVSIVISTVDERMVVLRNGREIGAAPVRFDPGIVRPAAFSLRAIDATGLHWLQLPFPGAPAPEAGMVTADAPNPLNLPEGFRQSLAAILTPGATVVITADSLARSKTGRRMTVISNEDR